ncbi:MAG: ligase-associated DNA damage response DEXH box helicase [Saprospiraceae bacterium]
MQQEALLQRARDWFAQQNWTPFPFQEEAWRRYLAGESGLVNAPTGSGKTYSLIIPILLEFIKNQPQSSLLGGAEKGQEVPSPLTPQGGTASQHPPSGGTRGGHGLQAIWITPIRALTKEIQQFAQRAVQGLGLNWTVGVRSGDTSTSERTKQKEKPPELLITTPESLHLMLATKGYPQLFKNVKSIVIDEWHELIGSKRGVQVELALSRLRALLPELKVWGISATIGNMQEAVAPLLSPPRGDDGAVEFPPGGSGGWDGIIRSNVHKKIEVISVLPDEIETFPWAGHLGIKLAHKVLPIIENSKSTLIFTNTRAFCERWYQTLLEIQPDLAGVLAMHHSSLSREIRDWVENALHEGSLKAVVATSSLDLGVDFRPVETVIQIGSPKGVARFLQRAGRSGHQPGATSKIYFVPTHSLELLEGAALREAINRGEMESRIPYIRSFDVLAQYLVTLAVSEGFKPQEIYHEIKKTYSFSSITQDEWAWVLNFITSGGDSLHAYDEYKKVEVENGIYKVTDRRTALRHRLSIGTIVSDVNLTVKYVGGGFIGTIEEWFISQLKPGDVFWFAGRSLEFVRLKDMIVQVRRSEQKTGRIPSWQGGRMPLSSELSKFLRIKMDELAHHNYHDIELKTLQPLAQVQQKRSHIPTQNEFLIEYFPSREGHHLLLYPFEGRFVHEGLGALLAYRIAQLTPISFTIAMNDYGLELLSDQEIPIDQALENDLFSTQHLLRDIQSSVNSVEMAKRRFRDIAGIAGLVFKGYPGNRKKDKHLQSSSQLFFQVFQDYEPNNLLLLEAYDEVMTFQLEEARLRRALERINRQNIILKKPNKATPFSFPIIVDRMREKLTSEKLEDRIKKMRLQLVKE